MIMQNYWNSRILDILLTWPDDTTSNSRTDWTSAKVFKLMNNDSSIQDTVGMSIVHIGHLIFNINSGPVIYLGWDDIPGVTNMSGSLSSCIVSALKSMLSLKFDNSLIKKGMLVTYIKKIINCRNIYSAFLTRFPTWITIPALFFSGLSGFVTPKPSMS